MEEKDREKKQITIVKKKRKLKKWVWILLTIFFLSVLLISLMEILFWQKDNNKTKNIINKIEEIVKLKEIEDNEDTEIIPPSEEVSETSDYWYYISFPLIDVNLVELKEKNTDTIAWLNVNNTNINYPVVQTTDNSFYLNHSFDKSYNEAGWVFLDYRNNSDFSNRNNIIYAHSRLDKTMFGSLSKTLSSSWYSNLDNHIIRLSTENENSLWQIFSVYVILEETYYITTSFANDDKYLEFLETIKARSRYDFATSLSADDKILTLSTCYSDTERTVVHAKLIKRQAK